MPEVVATEPSTETRLILASASAARAQLLAAAGLDFEVRPSTVDEAAIRQALDVEERALVSEDVAVILAEAKALDVSAFLPEALIIAGDQVLAFDGEILAKPKSIKEAYRQLTRLAGNTHILESSVVCAQGGKTLWRHVSAARMTMREFSPQFLESYLARVGGKALTSVGAYQLEGPGVQLFSKIEGDYFTVLGLPLLPLLEFLRAEGILQS